MKYWILKTEPESYSFADLVKDKKTCWNGVRNYLARNNIRAMSVGDIVVIYESVGPKAAVGTAKVKTKAYKDPGSEEDWSCVDIVPVKSFKAQVTLAQMKADKTLKNMSLVKQSRLSVCSITADEFNRLVELGGGE